MLRPFSDIKIFIISLPRENKRRAAMQEKLQGISDDFEFFDAIDGAKEKLSQHQDYVGLKRRLFYGKDLSDGELGCFFSHRALINKIVQFNLINTEVPKSMLFQNFKCPLLAESGHFLFKNR